MIAEGNALGFALPLVQQTLGVFDQASKQGWGSKDCTAFWSTSHRN